MPASLQRPAVYVEGKSDHHALGHLLMLHGIDYRAKPPSVALPEFHVKEGDRPLLDGIETAVMSSGGLPLAFILDVDTPLRDRWHAVRDRLDKVDVPAPETPPPDGFIGDSRKYRTRIGVWLMPDNQQPGTLEHFLEMLIDEGDALLQYAKRAVSQAKRKGAKFRDGDRKKAVIHTWLAWQQEPGLPYGSAVRAKFFQHNSAAAQAFVAWFGRLFGVS